MDDHIFESCSRINDLLTSGGETGARNELIKLLDYHKQQDAGLSPMVNHFIRELGLYPYLDIETASWQERYVHEAFKVDNGSEEPVTLHRAQSKLLRKLIDGDNLAISAPTSFGKSFIVDAYISIIKPKNVAIIVPTIALTDETRRRLYPKFSSIYKIITTSEVELSERNIFIFPQERAIHYVDKIDELDILIIDEFYKASPEFDKERSPALLKAILKLGEIAHQKYFLAPHISNLNDSIFTIGMEFLHLDFNTVFLKKHELYRTIGNDEVEKGRQLLSILSVENVKSLIYAGTYSQIDKVANLLIDNVHNIQRPLLDSCAEWLSKHYDANWKLVSLIKCGTGIHNGQLHRSLSQIQIKLFEDDLGLSNIVSTSSIIEGVNTSAENVIVWKNRNGNSRLNDFMYRNIIGRGGRMFKHFIGQIYLLEQPPCESDTQLNLEFPDELLADVDAEKYEKELTPEQLVKIIEYKEEMANLLGAERFARISRNSTLHTSNPRLITNIVRDMVNNPREWNGFGHLNSPDVQKWDRCLYKVINLIPGGWEIEYSKFVAFIKILSCNWDYSIPQLLIVLEPHGIDIKTFFKLERNVTYKFSALLNDVNILQQELVSDGDVDISPFISAVSHAFLPAVIYQLEEYGLPRMLSKKIQNSNAINLCDKELTLHQVIDQFNTIGLKGLVLQLKGLDAFDLYILNYFYEGIRSNY
jgi:hypothetical protein